MAALEYSATSRSCPSRASAVSVPTEIPDPLTDAKENGDANAVKVSEGAEKLPASSRAQTRIETISVAGNPVNS